MASTLSRLFGRRESRQPAEILYEAIVAQARLPALYAESGMPDTIEGRFEMLGLHLFVVQRRLLTERSEGAEIAQELSDAFVRDMETVMRERGEGDLAVPKKVRKLAGEIHGRTRAWGTGMEEGGEGLAKAIAATCPLDGPDAERAGQALAPYVTRSAAHLQGLNLDELKRGELGLPSSTVEGR